MSYGLHLIKNPNDTYSFVGSVPIELGYVTKAGNKVTAGEVQSQLLLPASYRIIKPRVFTSIDSAMLEARRLGYNVNSVLDK